MRATSGCSSAASRAPPNVPAKILTRVTPTCTVGKNVCGSSASSRATRAPGTFFRSSTASLARRAEISASSPMLKMPLSKISSRMTAISSAAVMARAGCG
jgi:hypothetical protein